MTMSKSLKRITENNQLLIKVMSIKRKLDELTPYQKFRSIAKSIFYWTVLFHSARKFCDKLKETKLPDIKVIFSCLLKVGKLYGN